jgi:hypothetical protein
MPGELEVDIYICLKVIPGPVARGFAGLDARRVRDGTCLLDVAERLAKGLSCRWQYRDVDGRHSSKDDLAAWLSLVLSAMPDQLKKDYAGHESEGRKRGATAMAEHIEAALRERWQVALLQP